MHNVPKKRRLQIRKPVPYVTITLIVVNVAVLLAQWLDARVGQVLIFAPGIAHEEPYRFISSTFMHAGFTHLLFNMYALWLIGSVLERMIGWWRFLGLYLLSAVAGNVMVLYTVSTDIDYYTGTVGASGAVFGIFAAMFVVLRRFGGSFTQMAVVIAINLSRGRAPHGRTAHGDYFAPAPRLPRAHRPRYCGVAARRGIPGGRDFLRVPVGARQAAPSFFLFTTTPPLRNPHPNNTDVIIHRVIPGWG